MANLLKGENNGVIVDARPTDFRAGAESGVVYEVRNLTGDWTSFRSNDEWQRRYVNGFLGYDTNSCTNFSCTNSVEAQIDMLVAQNAVPDATLAKMKELGYFDANGKVNFNDWFNAITSGTNDTTGNTLYAPWDAIRKYGLIAQPNGFTPNDFSASAGWFGAVPTAAQYALGLEFLKLFDVAYEWVDLGVLDQWDAFTMHLKHAPLHVLVPTGSTWNNPMVTNTGPYVGVNHAVTVLSQMKDVSHSIFDHYNPFMKNLSWDYYIPYALKGVVTVKTTTAPPPAAFHYVYLVNLKYGAPDNADVHALQQGLQQLGYMKIGLFGPYGPQTKVALGKFQSASGITDPDGQGSNFGPQTRKALTDALK